MNFTMLQAWRWPCLLLFTLPLLIRSAYGHSWIEQMQVISSHGHFSGDYGYPRGYMARTDPGYNGYSMTYLIPALSSDRTRINASDLLCHPSQRSANYSSHYPPLKVQPGDFVSMKYLENGHVTQPHNQLGKPKGAGSVFVYMTTQPKDDEKILDVLHWNRDGSGGDKRGTLVTAQNFDDGRCHQISAAALSVLRQQDFPDRVPEQPTSNVEQWCETDLKIPQSVAAGGRITFYWLWQWPTAPGADPTYPDGKDEYYSTCLDFDIPQQLELAHAPVHTLLQQDPQTTACEDFESRTAYVEFPSITTASESSRSAPSATTPSTGSSSSSTAAPVACAAATVTTTLTITATVSATSSPTSQAAVAPVVGSGGIIQEQARVKRRARRIRRHRH